MEAARLASKCTTFSLTIGSLQRRSRVGQSLIIIPRKKRCTVIRSGGGQQDDEDRPETLFMRELAKRKKLGQDVETTETKLVPKLKEEDARVDVEDQRKRSMALNSEGLDGLIPRGRELVKLGGTFWLSFWPFIAASFVFFLASYLYFGPAFVHSGNRVSPPAYVDPYLLLDSEELPPQVGPSRVPYRSPQ